MKSLLGLGLILVVASAFSAGCGTDCECICEEQNECPGAVAEDCSTSCANTATLNAEAGCGAQYDALINCVSDVDACVGGDRCAVEQSSWNSCVSSYCGQNPGAVGCPS
mgnify:CR=1 FL=1